MPANPAPDTLPATARAATAASPGDAVKRPLILASTSRYRRELLQRLPLPFQVMSPGVDESAQTGETPAALAGRLAMAKALAVAALHPEAVVIGSDQVADLEGQVMGKPGSYERARDQLLQMSGRQLVFQTAVAVACTATGFAQLRLVPVTVQMRTLHAAEIERYLALEQPYDCAGSAKSEALGIALLQAVHSSDPTALVGLPLIATCDLLRAAGLDPLGVA
jgi:septum formation protein